MSEKTSLFYSSKAEEKKQEIENQKITGTIDSREGTLNLNIHLTSIEDYNKIFFTLMSTAHYYDLEFRVDESEGLPDSFSYYSEGKVWTLNLDLSRWHCYIRFLDYKVENDTIGTLRDVRYFINDNSAKFKNPDFVIYIHSKWEAEDVIRRVQDLFEIENKEIFDYLKNLSSGDSPKKDNNLFAAIYLRRLNHNLKYKMEFYRTDYPYELII